MSDELTIQPGVNPQIQPKKTSTTPYALGGAAVGAAVGGAVNHYIKKPMSWEDVIKEAKDTTDFSTKTEPASWEGVKAKAKEVEEAKKALEEASKPQLVKGSEKEAYEAAVKDKETAFQKLFDSQKAALEKNNTSTSTIDVAKIKKFSEIPATDLPTTNVKTGKPFKGNELQSLYTKLTDDLVKAENALDATLNAGLRKEKNIYRASIANNVNEAMKDLKGMSDEQISEYFAEKEVGGWLHGKKPSKQYARVLSIADNYYPKPTDLKPEQYLEIGKELEKGEKAPKGWLSKAVTVKNDTGRSAVKTVYYDPAEARKLLDSEIERVADLRTAAADQIFAETQKAVQIKSQINGLVDKVGAEIKADVAKETGLYTPATATAPDKLDMSAIVKEGRGKNTWVSPSGKTKLEGYSADIKKLEDAIANAKKTGVTPVMPTKMNSAIAPGTSVKVALKQIQNRNIAYKEFVKQNKALEKQLDEAFGNNSIVQELSDKISETIAGDKKVLKAKSKLTEQFPALFGETTTQKLSADEIAAKAKEYAEKNMKASYQEAVDKAKAALDKAAGEKGVVNEELKKAAQGKLETAEKALKEAAEELGAKVKTGGTNKWIAAGIGAAIGAAALWGIASSKNKNV